MAKVYISDLNNDLGAYVALQIDYKNRLGSYLKPGRDEHGDFIEVPDPTDDLFSNSGLVRTT